MAHDAVGALVDDLVVHLKGRGRAPETPQDVPAVERAGDADARQRGAEQHDEFVLREGNDAEEDEHRAAEQPERPNRHHEHGDAVKL